MRLARDIADWLISALLVGCFLAFVVSSTAAIIFMMWQAVL